MSPKNIVVQHQKHTAAPAENVGWHLRKYEKFTPAFARV